MSIVSEETKLSTRETALICGGSGLDQSPGPLGIGEMRIAEAIARKLGDEIRVEKRPGKLSCYILTPAVEPELTLK